MLDAIEISSSPEPTHTAQDVRTKTKGKAKANIEVIELTDSDDDELSDSRQSHLSLSSPAAAPGGSSRHQRTGGVNPERSLDASPGAGPSRTATKRRRLSANSSFTEAFVFPSKADIDATSSAISLSSTSPENRSNGFIGRISQQGNVFVSSDEENGPPARPQQPPNPCLVPSPLSTPPLLAPNPSSSRPHKPETTPPKLTTVAPSALAIPPLVESPEEAMTRAVAQVLEIIPDVDPDHLSALVAEQYPAHQVGVVERVLHLLFEDPRYPRVQKGPDKGKRKASGPDGNSRSAKRAKVAHEEVDYNSVDRPFVGGRDYHDLALGRLQLDYPYTPKPYLRFALVTRKGFYAPTFLFLKHLDKQNSEGVGELPYAPRKTPYRPPQAKGKDRELVDDEFSRELAWTKRQLVGDDRAAADEALKTDEAGEESEIDESDGEDEDNGIECGCCFSKFRFEKMIQCPDTHLFCRTCLRSYASTLLGTHNPIIKCMSQSPCTFSFPASELSRVLSKKLFALYERLIQAKEIEEAALEGLEECPFCEWKCVIENEEEKLFRCGNEDGGCGVVSCRKCGRLDHLPKSCQEVEEDKKLDARHTVEEAMTQALMRNCPKCKKAFIKESGCNKMTCPNCKTLSCYICRQVVTGYEHFSQRPGQPTASTNPNAKKCVLWDKNLDKMHAIEVQNAAEKAIAQVKAANPDVEDKDLKVDVPKVKSSRQKNNWNPRPAYPYNANVHPGQNEGMNIRMDINMNVARPVALNRRGRGGWGGHARHPAPAAPLPLPNQYQHERPHQAVVAGGANADGVRLNPHWRAHVLQHQQYRPQPQPQLHHEPPPAMPHQHEAAMGRALRPRVGRVADIPPPFPLGQAAIFAPVPQPLQLHRPDAAFGFHFQFPAFEGNPRQEALGGRLADWDHHMEHGFRDMREPAPMFGIEGGLGRAEEYARPPARNDRERMRGAGGPGVEVVQRVFGQDGLGGGARAEMVQRAFGRNGLERGQNGHREGIFHADMVPRDAIVVPGPEALKGRRTARRNR